jgi:hypothetical protein
MHRLLMRARALAVDVYTVQCRGICCHCSATTTVTLELLAYPLCVHTVATTIALIATLLQTQDVLTVLYSIRAVGQCRCTIAILDMC